MTAPAEVEMPFLEHIRELRTRIIRITLGLVIGTAVALYTVEPLFHLLILPFERSFPGALLIGTGPTDAFMTKLMVGIVGGFLLSLPLTFYQLWLFVAPGLHDHERRFVLPFVALSTLCFLAGAAFCYEFVLPVAFTFFSGEFQSLNVAPQIRMEEYLSFTIKFILVFGAIFELPILSYFLARAGLLTHQWLIEKVRYSIVAIFVIAAVLTPPDVVSQMLMAGPLLVLYALCIGVAYLAAPATLEEAEGSQLESNGQL